MDAFPEHTIAFTGLKDGEHRFTYELDDAFFKATENPRYPVLLDRYELTTRYLNTADFLAERKLSFGAERKMLAGLNLLKK